MVDDYCNADLWLKTMVTLCGLESGHSGDHLNSRLCDPPRCPTPCDDDCEAVCHEAHAADFKRCHDPVECEDIVLQHQRKLGA